MLGGDDPGFRVVDHALGVNPLQRIGYVGLASLDHQCTGGGIGHAAHDDRLYARRVAPVLWKRLEHNLDARVVANKLVGSGADRVLLETVLADLGEVFLRHHQPRGGGGAAVKGHKVGPDFLQVKTNDTRIDDFDP
jgi:hypothetical protein